MEHIIFTHDDSNMAGFEWGWALGLRRTIRSGYTLHIKNTTNDDEYGPVRVPAIKGIRTGRRLYEAVTAALQEANIEFTEDLVPQMADALVSFDPVLAREFTEAPEIIERQEVEKTASRLAARADALRPFLRDIDDAMGPPPPNPGARAGGGWTVGGVRGRRRHHLEEFVLEHGCLPSKKSTDVR